MTVWQRLGKRILWLPKREVPILSAQKVDFATTAANGPDGWIADLRQIPCRTAKFAPIPDNITGRQRETA